MNVIDHQKQYAKIINLAGMQRMLSQRIRIYAQKIHTDNSDANLKQLHALMKEMKLNSEFILNNLETDEIRKIYLEKDDGLKFQIDEYLEQVKHFIQSKNKKDLKKIGKLSEDILPNLNNMVKIFEHESNEDIEKLRTREIIIIGGIILTLLFEAIFIIIPTFRRLRVRETEVREMNSILHGRMEALNSFALVSETDTNGTITYVNDKFVNLSKFERDELIGKNHRVLKSGWHPQEFYKNIWSTISKGESWIGTIKNRAKDGSYYWVNSLIYPLKNYEGQITKYISIRIDVSKIKELEHKLSRSLEYKERFIAELSHEIRTPINLLSGIAEELDTYVDKARNHSEKDIKQLTKVLKHTSNHMVEVLDGVLDYASLERGKLNAASYTFSINDVVNSTKQLFSYSCKTKKVNFSFTGDTKHNEIFFGQQKHIKQCLFNLVNNAIKFTPPKGKVEVEVKVDYEEEKTRRVHFKIKDSGIGIAKENINKIFTPFVQENSDTKEIFGGTGIGLSVTKAIIEFLHGDISVESESGVGTTFHFEIPLQVADIVPLQENHTIDLSSNFLEGKKVLFIEDDEDLAQLYSFILNGTGALVTTVTSVDQVEQLENLEEFNFIITDYFIGEDNGVDLIKKIKARNNNIHILVSGNEVKIEDGIFDSILLKPIKKDTLKQELYRLSNKT